LTKKIKSIITELGGERMKEDIERIKVDLGELKEEVKGLSIFKTKALKIIGFLTGLSIVLGIIGVWEYITISKFKDPSKPIQDAIENGKTIIAGHIRKEVNKIAFPKGIDASGNVTISGNLDIAQNAKIAGIVGVGTDSPSKKLHVRSNGSSGGILIEVDSDNRNHSAVIEFTEKNMHGASVTYYPMTDSLILNNDLGWDLYVTKKGNTCVGGYIQEWATDGGAMRRLMVAGNARRNENGTPIVVDIARFQGTIGYIDFDSGGNMITAKRDLRFRTRAGNQIALTLTEGGNVVVEQKLIVNGPFIHNVQGNSADYVFESSYQLISIEDQSRFMWKNKHLPAVPKRKVDENGNEVIEIGEYQRGLLEELEKAHIYISRLNEKLKEKDDQISLLIERVQRLEKAEFK
jgi:hypothetical protein